MLQCECRCVGSASGAGLPAALARENLPTSQHTVWRVGQRQRARQRGGQHGEQAAAAAPSGAAGQEPLVEGCVWKGVCGRVCVEGWEETTALNRGGTVGRRAPTGAGKNSARCCGSWECPGVPSLAPVRHAASACCRAARRTSGISNAHNWGCCTGGRAASLGVCLAAGQAALAGVGHQRHVLHLRRLLQMKVEDDML